MTLLEELEATVQEAAEQAGPAVVGLGRGWGVGSGVVVAPGRVLTNAHNLRHEETTVTFGDGRHESGRVAGSDPDLDVAVIEVDTGDIEPVAWSAQSAPPAIGRAVLALGNPGGRGLRVTPGFVSSLARAASAAPAGAGSRARSSTRRRCREAPPAVRCSIAPGAC